MQHISCLYSQEKSETIQLKIQRRYPKNKFINIKSNEPKNRKTAATPSAEQSN